MGREFVILTDHASLTHLQMQAHLSRRQARWLDFLGEFKFEVLHIAGKKNVADYFSRVPGYDTLTGVTVVMLNDVYVWGAA